MTKPKRKGRMYLAPSGQVLTKICKACDGTGKVRPAKRLVKCKTCNGSGEILEKSAKEFLEFLRKYL